MALTSAWLRRAGSATAASLALPVAVLVAAGALAVGGLGGLGSLGQVSAGPDLPNTEPAADTSSAVGTAAAAVTSAPTPTVAAGTPTSSGTSGPAGPPSSGAIPRTTTPPSAGSAPAAPTPPSSSAPAAGGGGGGGNTPVPQQPAPTQGGPLGQTIDQVRGIGESLPGPVGPVTGEVLDKVLGSPPKR